MSLDGTNYFYVNPLRQVEPLPVKLRWSRTRVPFVTSYCCPPNVLRTIAEVNGFAYSTSRRCGLGESLWRQHAGDGAKRQAAEVVANDELSVGRPGADRGRRMPGEGVCVETSHPWLGGIGDAAREWQAGECKVAARHVRRRFAATGSRATWWSSICRCPRG